MISDQDITKLKTVFAIKEEFRGLKEEVADLRLEVGEVNDKLDHLLTNVDNFTGIVYALREDNAAGSVAQYRHDRHIQALAGHVGFTLPEE